MSAKEKTTGFLAEFRKFIARGNVMDLAVGVIIGGAFKGITDSLVNDILNPVLGIFAGDNEALAGLAIPLPGGGDLMLGSFLNAILSFLIMAFVVFCIVKLLSPQKGGGRPSPAPQAIGGGGAPHGDSGSFKGAKKWLNYQIIKIRRSRPPIRLPPPSSGSSPGWG